MADPRPPCPQGGAAVLEPSPALAGIDTVRRRYAGLSARAEGVPPGRALPGGALPPYLCGRLNHGRWPAGPPGSEMLGCADASLVEFGTGALRLRYATGLSPDVMRELNLPGYRTVLPGPRTTARLTEAVDTLPELSPWAAAVVGDFVGAVVLLKPRPDLAPLGETMSSCSFASLPFTVFLTGLGLHRLPPGFMFTEPSVYSLQESLLHEALLLWLNEAERVAAPFCAARDRATKVYVSWHNEWWSAGGCLRELFVYAHLPALRAAALERTSGPRAALLEEALRSADACARELLHSLTARRELFTPAGRELLADLGRLLPRRLPRRYS